MKKNRYDVSIIIVNFNSAFWLRKTLNSLREYVFPKSSFTFETIVVDNGSTDESLVMLHDEFSWVTIIPLSDNRGFAAANNVALQSVSGRFVMLVNSDIEFTANSHIDSLLKFAQKKKQVAVVSPKLIFSTGEIDPACHRGEPTPWASITYFTKLEKLFPTYQKFGQYHQGWKDLNTIHTIDACSGAAMIVKKKVIDEVGLLDERFFMYAEDLDWCKRMRDAGYLIVYHPGSVVIHHKYKSGIKTTSQKIATQTQRHFYDTMLQYFDKHYASQYPRVVRKLVKVFIVSKKGAL